MWPDPRIPYRLETEHPRLAPPHGKPLVDNVVAAIEYWPFDRPMPRGALPAPRSKPSEPPAQGPARRRRIDDAEQR